MGRIWVDRHIHVTYGMVSYMCMGTVPIVCCVAEWTRATVKVQTLQKTHGSILVGSIILSALTSLHDFVIHRAHEMWIFVRDSL